MEKKSIEHAIKTVSKNNTKKQPKQLVIKQGIKLQIKLQILADINYEKQYITNKGKQRIMDELR